MLVRRETNPDDLPGMVAAEGVLTARGGKTARRRRARHGQALRSVALKARDRMPSNGTVTVAGRVLTGEDVIAIDGQTGEIFPGRGPVTDSPVTTWAWSHGLKLACCSSWRPRYSRTDRGRPPHPHHRRRGAPPAGSRQ